MMERGKVRIVLLGYTQLAGDLLLRIVSSDPRFVVCTICNDWDACREALDTNVPDVLMAREGTVPSGWQMGSSSLLWTGESPTLEAVSCAATAAEDAVPSLLRELSHIYGEVLQEKARQLRSLLGTYQQAVVNKPHITELRVRRGDAELEVPLQQVEWIEGAGNWVRVHTPVGVYSVREMINEVLEKLPDRQFIRIHRSTVVNRSRIVEVTMQNDLPQSLVMESGISLNIGVTFRRPLLEKSLLESRA